MAIPAVLSAVPSAVNDSIPSTPHRRPLPLRLGSGLPFEAERSEGEAVEKMAVAQREVGEPLPEKKRICLCTVKKFVVVQLSDGGKVLLSEDHLVDPVKPALSSLLCIV